MTHQLPGYGVRPVRLGTRIGALLAAGWLMSAAGCWRHVDAEDAPVIHDGLSEPVQAWLRAVEAGDVDAIADMYMPNSRAFPLGKPQILGMPDITDGYADLFAKYSVHVVVRDAHYLATPQLTASWGQAEWTLTPRKRDGPPTVVLARFSDLAALDHGRWRYVLEHVSTPAVPQAPVVPGSDATP